MDSLQTMLTVLLALLMTGVAGLFLFQWLRSRRHHGLVLGAPSASDTATLEVNGVDDSLAPPQTVATVERGKLTLHGLLLGLSENVQSLMGRMDTYGSRLDEHQSFIKKAQSSSALQQVEQMLSAEVDSMRRATEQYRRQLEEANARIRQQEAELQKLSTDAFTDFLTKIANRRAFDKRLAEEFERYNRYRQGYSLIMIDIDHFKRINDSLGHVAGDRILRAVATILQEEQRGSDFFARYGGEEIAVILPGTDCKQALVVADKMRRKVESARLNYEGQSVSITISAGVAQVGAKDRDAIGIVGRADQALYRAKDSGRNRVENNGTGEG